MIWLAVAFVAGALTMLVAVRLLRHEVAQLVQERRHWSYADCVKAGHYMSSSGDGSSVWCWDDAHGDNRPKMYVER